MFLDGNALPDSMLFTSSQKHEQASCVQKCQLVHVSVAHDRVSLRVAVGNETGEVISELE